MGREELLPLYQTLCTVTQAASSQAQQHLCVCVGGGGGGGGGGVRGGECGRDGGVMWRTSGVCVCSNCCNEAVK